MSSQPVDPDYVPSGFMHPDKRRSARFGRGESQRNTTEQAEIIGRVFVERSVRAKELAAASSVIREAKKSNARSRREAPKSRRSSDPQPTKAMGATPERMAKGDVVVIGHVRRSLPPIEIMAQKCQLDEVEKTNLALFYAAQKLAKHYANSINGVRATDSVDLSNDPGGYSALGGEEGWVHHYDQLQKARTMMGYFPDRPHHGCARIVMAVVCDEIPYQAAAKAHLPPMRDERAHAIAMDRLRSGLFTLAALWGFV